ncbi:MAG TPA: hypothetical protein VLD18_06520, partial [Verrucomicrobiae bacterium]|nr:hypothetical protein [Verrucomicrobiae bacterium]
MNAEPKAPNDESGGEFAARRESVRRGMLRANRTVMALLAVAFLLGVAMLAASYRAHQNQRRAETAEQQATERLWSSYLAQARAERLSTEAGHRAAALAAITNAAAIQPSTELRDEALASLGLRDLRREVVWPLQERAYGFHFDADLRHYVVSYADTELSLFRLSDNVLVRTLRAAEAGLDTNAVVREFLFSRTGRYIAMQYSTGTMVLWEKDSGRAIHVLGKESGTPHLQWPPSFTADDRHMGARSAVRPNEVVFMELASGETRHVEIPGLTPTVQISPAGDLFTWFRGTNIFFHHVSSGTLHHTVTSETEFVGFWWDAQGEHFSVACRDSTLYIGDVRSDRLRQLGGRAVNPWQQQFSPDGSLLVTAGSDGTSRLWDVA